MVHQLKSHLYANALIDTKLREIGLRYEVALGRCTAHSSLCLFNISINYLPRPKCGPFIPVLTRAHRLRLYPGLEYPSVSITSGSG